MKFEMPKALPIPESAESRIAKLEDRLARLEAATKVLRSSETHDSSGELKNATSRRGLLKLAGALALGGTAVNYLGAQPAAANDNANFVLGISSNTSTSSTVLTRTGTGQVAAFKVVTVSADVGADGIRGVSGSSTGSSGVVGESESGVGLYGESRTGYGVYCGGNGRIGMTNHTVIGSPTSGTYDLGDIVRDQSGNAFLCVTAGSPGAWRKLGGPQSAGQLHLVPPVRIYDTRQASRMVSGSVRTIDLSATLPNGTSAALVSAGVFEPSSDGYLSLSAFGTGSTAINVYWSLPNTSIANTTVTALSMRKFDIKSTLSGGSTNVFVDLLGYYV